MLIDQGLKLSQVAHSKKKRVKFPSPEDLEFAINLIGSGRLRLRLFMKSLETVLGISEFQLGFIELIGRKKNISPKELTIELDVNKATISGHLEKLIENNFVQESPSPIDKRKKVLTLTEQGVKLYRIVNIFESRIISRLLIFIGPKVYKMLKDHILEIIDTIDAKKQLIKSLFHEKPGDLFQILVELTPEEIVDKVSQIFPFLSSDSGRLNCEQG